MRSARDFRGKSGAWQPLDASIRSGARSDHVGLSVVKGGKMSLPGWFYKVPRALLVYYGALAAWLATTAMHIPDGYLSPATSLVMFLVVLPFWALGLRRLRQTANSRNIPVIALVAAFAFVTMMFNIPLPGGTSGHAVGGALAAIVLGPEIATIAISTALVIQAFFFGDGGILALGANCFNMGVVLPYVSYGIYQWISRSSPLTARRRTWAAAVGGWTGLTVGALFAGFEFGIQPLLFHTANGTPLYAPYPLSISIPAMVLPHALIASVVEGLVTGLVVAYLQRTDPARLGWGADAPRVARRSGRPWVILAALALATPLGLLAPGTAWGEWGGQELAKRGLGFVPTGLAQLNNLWGAPLVGYHLPALGNASLGYILSAASGILLIALLVWLYSLLLTRRDPGQRS
jgi:cobalt/nickel transport system permease protein